MRAAAKGYRCGDDFLEEDLMAAIETSEFSLRDVEARSDLQRFYLVRDHLPEAQLVEYLEVLRGQGRDEHPVRAMWNTLVAGVVFRLHRERQRARHLPAKGRAARSPRPGLRRRSQDARMPLPGGCLRAGCDGAARYHHAAGVAPGEYGRIVRIKLDGHDRRIFVPTPHGSPSWERGYHRRSALERINNRIDHSFGFERHFIRGLAKM